MENELEEVKCDIHKAKADLKDAKRDGDRELILAISRTLNLLLEKKKRLTTGSSNRNSTKQDSFRDKLIRRSLNRTTCGICSDDVGFDTLESAHIIDVAKRAILEAAYGELDAVLPASVNDTCNGLLLCPTCHSLFDNQKIQISGSGKILLCSELREKNYKYLHNTDVPWTRLIGLNINYPTKELLELATRACAKNKTCTKEASP